MNALETLDQFRVWLPGAGATSKPSVRAKPVLNTLRAWLDVARGPVGDYEPVWPRLNNYPYGPAPR